MNKLDLNQQSVINVADGKVIVRGPCFVTGEQYETPPFPATELQRYLDGTYAQNALRSLDEDNREFLISGTSPEGWKQLFEDTEE